MKDSNIVVSSFEEIEDRLEDGVTYLGISVAYDSNDNKEIDNNSSPIILIEGISENILTSLNLL